MNKAQLFLEDLVKRISADQGVDITRGPEGQLLFAAATDADFVVALEAGMNEGCIIMQSVIGKLTAPEETEVLRGLMTANLIATSMNAPTFALNNEKDAVLYLKALPTQRSDGSVLDFEGLNKALQIFLNQGLAARSAFKEGVFKSETALRETLSTPASDEEVIFRV